MQNTSERPSDEIERVVRSYGDMLFRICLVMLKNTHDAEDAVQETILKYMQKSPPFEHTEHEKAWLIKVAANQCRDIQRFWQRHPQTALGDVQLCVSDPESCGIIEALMTIPEKFKIVMLLYYVEEYPIAAIADVIGKSPSAVKMRLQKGRRLLEETYRKEYL